MLAESRYHVVGVSAAAATIFGQEPALVMAASDAVRNFPGYCADLRRNGISGVALFCNDAARRPYATPYELLVALSPVSERRIIDASRPGEKLPVGGAAPLMFRCALDAVTAPSHVLRGLTAHRVDPRKGARPPEQHEAPWVLALWRDAGETRVGGAVSHVSGILAGFRQLGCRVALVTNGEPPEQLRSAVDVVEVAAPLPRSARFTRGSARVAANSSMRRAALALALRTPPAFVYERHAYFCRVGADVSRELDVPLVLEWNNSAVWANRNLCRQGPLNRLLQRAGAQVERYSVGSATVVAAVSQASAQMARHAGADPATVAVVANAVDADSIPAPSSMPVREGALVGWSGSFDPWHGVEVAIESLRNLPADVELVLIGDGQQRPAYEELGRRLGVHDRITWTGRLPRTEALHVLSRCDVLVSPHQWAGNGPFFGSPIKLFEYMALGRPIVASRLGQIGEILQDGVTAVLAEPGDPADIARGIARVLAMPDRGAAWGANARREALEEHTWDRRAEQILARLPLSVPRPAMERG